MNVFTQPLDSPEVIEKLKNDGECVIEVTMTRNYIVSAHEDLPALMKEWFVRHRGRSHAYRDGSLVGGSDVVQKVKNLSTGLEIDLKS